jgi:hypothetical protein
MSLPTPKRRQHIHTRQIQCQGFKREDGLWDIEARLLDTKTYDFANYARGGFIPAGDAIHDMTLRVSVDLQFVIHEIDVVSEETPFPICKAAPAGMKKLVGLRMESGWMREVKSRVGGTAGCTHLIEMLGHIATTAFQTIHDTLESKAASQPNRGEPLVLDTCMALARNSEVVKIQWPEFYKKKG